MHQRWLLCEWSLETPLFSVCLSFSLRRVCERGTAFLFITPFCPLSLLTHQLIWQPTIFFFADFRLSPRSSGERRGFRNSLRWKTAATVFLVRRRKCCFCVLASSFYSVCVCVWAHVCVFRSEKSIPLLFTECCSLAHCHKQTGFTNSHQPDVTGASLLTLLLWRDYKKSFGVLNLFSFADKDSSKTLI